MAVTPSTATRQVRTLDANEAAASVAYRASAVIAVSPITPASAMGEPVDAWAAEGRTHLWGAVPQVVGMQSEGGAAGTVHGALLGGALVTAFTASQGLLLVLPDLFEFAGELTLCCLHVAARSVPTHALSNFGGHSDVPTDRVWASLPREVQQQLIERRCRVFAIDGYAQAEQAGLGRRINTVMQLCFFALSQVMAIDQTLQHPRHRSTSISRPSTPRCRPSCTAWGRWACAA